MLKIMAAQDGTFALPAARYELPAHPSAVRVAGAGVEPSLRATGTPSAP